MIMSDDELDRIKKKQLDDLLKHQQEQHAVQETPVIDLNSSNFDDALSKNKLLLVDFWAEWCGPCKMIGPILEELSDELSEKITIAKHNIDEEPNTPTKFGVRGIPTMLLFKDGELKSTKVGATTKSNLKSWIEENL